MLLRKTKSICPNCCRKVSADVIEEEDKIFMVKHCQKHGENRVILSTSPDNYKKFEKICSPFVCKPCGKTEIELMVTLRCNMDCAICYLGDFKKRFSYSEPTLDEIENIIIDNSKKAWRFIITGGEPTLREDLFEIIQLLKKYNRDAIMSSNGIRLADFNYVSKLKEAGIDRINIQLDGFNEDTERIFRRFNYLPLKMQALNNLKEMDIPVGISAALCRGMNENQVGSLLNFAINNDFVKSIGWCALAYAGGSKEYPLNNYIISDQAVDILETQTEGRISKQSVILFTKLFLAINVFFDRGWSRYANIYLLIKKNGGYEPIDTYINLPEIDSYMDKFFKLYLKSKLRGRIFFMLVFPIALFANIRYHSIIKELMFIALSFFVGRKNYLKPFNMLYIKIASQCDIHNFDSFSKQCCYNIYLKIKDKIHRQNSRNLSVVISRMLNGKERNI